MKTPNEILASMSSKAIGIYAKMAGIYALKNEKTAESFLEECYDQLNTHRDKCVKAWTEDIVKEIENYMNENNQQMKKKKKVGKVNSHKNVVSTPEEELNDLTLNFKINGKPTKFDFLTNIKADEIMAVFDNWVARTSKYTVQSFVDYINSKSHYGFYAEVKKK